MVRHLDGVAACRGRRRAGASRDRRGQDPLTRPRCVPCWKPASVPGRIPAATPIAPVALCRCRPPGQAWKSRAPRTAGRWPR
jgi:hypothetical protein